MKDVMKPRLRLVPPSPLPEPVGVREGFAHDPAARVPERLDERRYPGGHIWRRYPHEAVVLKARAMAGIGEGVR